MLVMPATIRLAVVVAVLVVLVGLVHEHPPGPRTATAQSGTVALHPIIRGLAQPLFVTHARDGSGRLYVVEKEGTIRAVVNGQIPATPFLDIRPLVVAQNEQGLLGLAFDPAYATSRRFYVYYTASGSSSGVGDNTVARYLASSANPNQADAASAARLLAIPDQYVNHNGGMLAFGPDGYLYVGTGDGGSAGDPQNNAQSLTSLLGKLLRLDVSGSGAYGIPPSNPFASSGGGTRREIWAYGLRNPWRFSFDRQGGDLFIADVGQGIREEVNRQVGSTPGGQNYGWRLMEGTACYNPSSGCNPGGLTLPIHEYTHSEGCSVTGGYVYRGAALPALRGAYIFADYCLGTVWSLRLQNGAWVRTTLLDTSYLISSFGEDENGELYVTDLTGGAVYRLADPSSTPPAVIPAPPLPPVGQTPTPTPTPAGPTATPTPTPAGPTTTPTRTPTGQTPTPTSTPVTGPDLVITAFTATSRPVDQPIPFTVTVVNRGTQSTGAGDGFDIHVFADLGRPPTSSDVRFVGHVAVPPLAAGATTTVNGEVFAGSLAAGNHTLWALADGHNTITETNESNNSASVAVTVGSPSSTSQTVTFDDRSGQNQPLEGEYPAGIVDWGTGRWHHFAPWKGLTTKHVGFAGAGAMSDNFRLLGSRTLARIDAYNGGTTPSTVTVSCAGQPTRTVAVDADHTVTIATGWTQACALVTISSTNGSETRFDNLVHATVSSASACSPRPPVGVSVTEGSDGRMLVIVEANTSGGLPNNALTSIRFGNVTNATIEMPGQQTHRGYVTVSLPPGTQRVNFVARPDVPGDISIQLAVFDACGEWRTIVTS